MHSTGRERRACGYDSLLFGLCSREAAWREDRIGSEPRGYWTDCARKVREVTCSDIYPCSLSDRKLVSK